MKVLVTGATGFVGGAIVQRLLSESQHVPIAAVRRLTGELSAELQTAHVGDLLPDTNWFQALNGVEAVIHTAARVHVMRDAAIDPLTEYRRVNVEGTLNLARQAVEMGIRRFVFISSIKVNGESTSLGKPFRADDAQNPADPYGVSKQEAEQGLFALSEKTGLEIVCIRPPLVYGPGVKANFQSMMNWLFKGVPLPLGAVANNRRSLVGLDNLVDLIVTCLDHPAAANQVFLAGDGEDLSTTELLSRVGLALGKPARLMPVPPSLLMIGATLLGKRAVAQRLLGSLQVDISKARDLLGWVPPVSVDEGLKKTAEFWLKELAKDR